MNNLKSYKKKTPKGKNQQQKKKSVWHRVYLDYDRIIPLMEQEY